MVISAAFIAPFPARDRRVAACFAASIAAHALSLFASFPVATVQPPSVLPPIDVRLVELPPPPKPQPPVFKEPQPVPAPPLPRIGVDRPAEPAAAPPPAIAFDPPMTEQEKTRLDPRFQPQAAVDRAATPLDQRPEPEYPPEAMANGITGCVLVVVYVGATGKVENIEVLRSDPPKIFDRAAMRAFVGGRYLPAVKDNAPVATRIAGVASFELEGKPAPMCALRYLPLVTELGGMPKTLGQDAAR